MCGVCAASSDNKIGDEGAKGLADWLRTNSTLQTLDLEGAYGGRGAGRGVGRRGSGRDGEGSGKAGKGEGGQGGHAACESGTGEGREGTDVCVECVWHLQGTRSELRGPRGWRRG